MSEQTISAYNRQAASYEAKWKNYLVHTHEAFLRRFKTTDGDTILDVSGGTGLLAKMLVDGNYAFKHLVINDPSEKMLAIARDRLSDEERISFSNDWAEEISVKSNQFDRIFCLNFLWT
ncbi:class I SAM-dependent methyltransferase [Fodinibius sediminis]|uniref:Methyltransferase domain-containing protein n=1 Tax=Fodinibius sediminis TaxID=1214077 RepID=A0A521FGB9_9BACT|nr:class I SAM-dependent methyltransferase [Fodinibius sediminis]SMO95222.1 Methyltransferase domain-containing protein [Fodinibius sediminis]